MRTLFGSRTFSVIEFTFYRIFVINTYKAQTKHACAAVIEQTAIWCGIYPP